MIPENGAALSIDSRSLPSLGEGPSRNQLRRISRPQFIPVSAAVPACLAALVPNLAAKPTSSNLGNRVVINQVLPV